MRILLVAIALVLGLGNTLGHAAIITYGDADCLGLACYGASDPTAGATTQGLGAGTITLASTGFGHVFPFSPGLGDFAGTDQIYVGSVQTGFHDGYSGAPSRINGPQTFTLDFSSLLGGQSLVTLTLGIAADDFQFPDLGQPFTATVNGSVNTALTAQLNSLNLGGPVVQFFTIGLNPSIDTGSHILTLSIDQAGDGGDGWAVDFLTVGVTTTRSSAVPEPSSNALLAAGLAFLLAGVRRRSHPRRTA